MQTVAKTLEVLVHSQRHTDLLCILSSAVPFLGPRWTECFCLSHVVPGA
jgi:hypothetical protein